MSVRYCPRHPTVAFSALKPCAECFDDPGPMPGEESTAIDAVDIDDEKLARDMCRELLDLARNQESRRDDNESQDRIGAAVVAKLYAEAGKALRLAREIRESWKRPAVDAKMFAEFKALRGKGRKK